MPLSEEELRLLEQMERALVEEDPKFASTLRGSALRHSARRRAVLAALAFAGGIALLMSGAVLQLPPVGIAGFVVMLTSATFGLAALRGHSAPAHPGDNVSHETGHSILGRMEDRWRRRRDRGV